MPVDLSVKPEVTGFFDPATNTISYVVRDPASNACAIVDSVMDIDYAAGRITYDHADQIITFVRDKGLTVEWLIETHVHADHLSAAPYIQRQLGGRIGIGRNITVVQDTFGKVFNEGTAFQRDGWTISSPAHSPAKTASRRCSSNGVGAARWSAIASLP